MQRVVSILLLSGITFAACWSLWLARADAAFRRNTPEAFEQAASLIPFQPVYLEMRALQTGINGGDAAAAWRDLAGVMPRASTPRIRLGLLAEQQGQLAAAERWLFEAYALDHQFETRWTLANFYFRQQRAQDFWTWIRAALEFSHGDRTAAFDLCWFMSEDSAQVQRAIPAVARADHLRYVLHHRPDAIRAAAEGVRGSEVLLAATDVLLDARRFDDAVALWTQAGYEAPQGVTNPDFAWSAGHGFDWRLLESPGVTQSRGAGGVGHRIRLSGKQPESVELLRQVVSLLPGERYRIEAEYAGDAILGLHWKAGSEPIDGVFTSTDGWTVLSLWYTRPRGEVRAEATVELRSFRLRRVP